MLKYKKIVELLARSKTIALYDVEPVQWISDGVAAYPMEGMPRFDELALRRAYDIDDKVLIVTEEGLPPGMCFEDIDKAENAVFPERVQLQPTGDSLTSFRTQRGTTFIKKRYLDVAGKSAEMNCYERLTADGGLYIAAKDGFRLQAVIMPMAKCPSKDYIDDLTELLDVLRSTQAAD